MKYKLPIFTLAAIVAGGLAIAGKLPGQAAGTAIESHPANARNAMSESGSSESLVARAATRFRQSPPLEAKIRQRVDLFGQQLVGVGSYAHAGQGSDQFRLELKIQLAENTTSLTQVCDGRYVWTRKDLGETKHLSRVDLERVSKALSTRAQDANSLTQWQTIGGLRALLDGLVQNFDFDEPGSSELGELPVWATTGRWRNAALAELLPDQTQAASADRPISLDALPAHLPTSVAIALGRDDYLPLFPYRIEFRRQLSPTDRKRASNADASLSKSIMTIELFEVRSPASLDPRIFTYDAGDQEVHDETEAVIARLEAK